MHQNIDSLTGTESVARASHTHTPILLRVNEYAVNEWCIKCKRNMKATEQSACIWREVDGDAGNDCHNSLFETTTKVYETTCASSSFTYRFCDLRSFFFWHGIDEGERRRKREKNEWILFESLRIMVNPAKLTRYAWRLLVLLTRSVILCDSFWPHAIRATHKSDGRNRQRKYSST